MTKVFTVMCEGLELTRVGAGGVAGTAEQRDANVSEYVPVPTWGSVALQSAEQQSTSMAWGPYKAYGVQRRFGSV